MGTDVATRLVRLSANDFEKLICYYSRKHGHSVHSLPFIVVLFGLAPYWFCIVTLLARSDNSAFDTIDSFCDVGDIITVAENEQRGSPS